MDEEKKNSILIVDDDRTNLKQLTFFLKPDYTIYAAIDGQTALEIAEQSLPDLIVLDVVMPGLNGFEVIEKLKASPKTKDIPVIFLTGVSDSVNERKGLELGAVDYIHKPFDDVIVKARVHNHMQLQVYKQNLETVVQQRTEVEVANRTISNFLAKISHELRTPVNSIVGFTELALGDGLPEQSAGYLKKVLENSQQLMKIIKDILDISKIESGKAVLQKINFNLHDVLSDCKNTILPKTIEKGLLMHLYTEPIMNVKPVGDPEKVRQIFISLLDNAVKFTNAGFVKLRAIDKSTGEDNVRIYFEIEDSGIGMTPEQLEVVFDPFKQTENGMKHRYGGTGLGLAIAKNNIEMMGGKLTAESIPGSGSKVSFELIFVNND